MATSPSFNKLAFFEDLGYKPHVGQLKVHESTAPRRVLSCGVRWGKSLSAAHEAIAAAMEPRDRCTGWVCAPTYDLCDKIFREIAIIAAQHLRHRIITLREGDRKLVLRNMSGGLSEVRGKSADNAVSLLGEGLDWLVVDEASRLKPAIWQNYLSQRLLDKKGWALLISTPKGKGWFFDLYRRGQGSDDHYQSWNSPSWENPILDRQLIEDERDRLPERVFRQEYGAEFLEGAGSVFRKVREAATGDWQEPNPKLRYYGGLDLAKVNDYTVLTIMNQKRELVFCDRFHRMDWEQQIERIKASCKRYFYPKILVDSTGAGEPVFEYLKKAGLYVEAYPFTNRSKNDLINNLSLMFEKEEITLPKPELWPEGIEELEAFEYDVTESGTVRMGAPSGMHDDCAISLALGAFLASQHRESLLLRYLEDEEDEDRELTPVEQVSEILGASGSERDMFF